MAKDNEYGAFRLKNETLEFLRLMKQAFELNYGKTFTNDEFIRQMAASVEEGDVAVWETYCELDMKIEELKEKAKRRRENEQ